MAVEVTVRLFAVLREHAGTDAFSVRLGTPATVRTARAEIAERVPALAPVLARMPYAVAVNREYAEDDTVLRDGDELALIPPVSGGDHERVHVEIDAAPVSLDRLLGFVADPGAGATVTFQGTTRTVDALEYEAYVEMAEPAIRAILRDVLIDTDAIAVAAHHRVGRVALGETSVLVTASAAHREAAFAAARLAIDRMKAEAPIWKKEIVGDSGEWVVGTAPPGPGTGVSR